MSIAKLYDAALATSSGLCLKSGCAGGKSDALARMEAKFGVSSQGAERPPKRFARDSKTKDLAGAGLPVNAIDAT